MSRKVDCQTCDGEKDSRAYQCRKCQMIYNHPRLGTGNGFVLHQKGYMMGCVDGRKMYEHQFVMEEYLGRRLEEGEVVHHIDGDPLNNNIENLELMTVRTHHQSHMTPEIAKKMSVLAHKKRWGK